MLFHRLTVALVALTLLTVIIPWGLLVSGAVFPLWGGRFGLTAEGSGRFVTSLLEWSAILVPLSGAVLIGRLAKTPLLKIVAAAAGIAAGALVMYLDIVLLRSALAAVEASVAK